MRSSAAKRAIAREAYTTARSSRFGRSSPSDAFRPLRGGAGRLEASDWAAVQVEMAKVRDEAHEQGERPERALALTALGEASIKREGDVAQARVLVDQALEILANEDDSTAHFDVLVVRATVASWQGSESDAVRFMERAYVIASMPAARISRRSPRALARTHIMRLELDEAELLLTRALELAGESGSARGR